MEQLRHLSRSHAAANRSTGRVRDDADYDWRVTFWDVVGHQHVRQAVAEYDRLGQDEFLSRYGFGRARAYLLIVDGKSYDSKAILGVAYGFAAGRG
jgi:hypothetical protein